MGILLTDPGDSLVFEMDWSDALEVGVTLSTVEHTVPAPLTRVGQSQQGVKSFVRVTGAVHGGMYQIEGAAQLSTGETLNRQFPLRCFNG